MTAVQIFWEWVATLVEVVLYFSILHTITDNRLTKKAHTYFFFAVSAAIATGGILLNLVELSVSLPTILYGVVSLALGACILYQGEFIEFLFASVGFMAFTLSLDMLSISCIGYWGMGDILPEIVSEFSFYRLCYISIIKIVQTILVFLFCCLIKRVAFRLKMSMPYTVTIVCLVLGCIGSIYWVTQTKRLIGFSLNQFQIIVGISCVLAVCAIYLLSRIREVQKAKEYAIHQSEILERNYLTAKASYESNAKLYHDMKNHLSLVQSYLTDGKVIEAQKYLGEINGIANHSINQWTGIGAIDYILSQKADTARKQGIDISIHAEYPNDCKIEPVDLCTILTNLLDNAIEACEKQPKGAEKTIKIIIRRIHQFIIIRITNTSVAEPIASNGIFATTKVNQRNHGWGIRSVKSAVEKYQGTIEFDYDNSIFTVSVMLFYQ